MNEKVIFDAACVFADSYECYDGGAHAGFEAGVQWMREQVQKILDEVKDLFSREMSESLDRAKELIGDIK